MHAPAEGEPTADTTTTGAVEDDPAAVKPALTGWTGSFGSDGFIVMSRLPCRLKPNAALGSSHAIGPVGSRATLDPRLQIVASCSQLRN